jgi:hypothetical protein
MLQSARRSQCYHKLMLADCIGAWPLLSYFSFIFQNGHFRSTRQFNFQAILVSYSPYTTSLIILYLIPTLTDYSVSQ